MNFLGMGMFEIAVVLLIGFLALGPSRSIEVARTAGKVVGDLRRTVNEVIAATNLEVQDRTADRGASRPAGESPEQDKQ